MVAVEGVDALHEAQHALLAVGHLQRGQFDGAQQLSLHFGRVERCLFRVEQAVRGGCHLFVVQVQVKVLTGLCKLAFEALFVFVVMAVFGHDV